MVPGAGKAAWRLGPAAGTGSAEERRRSRATETAHGGKKREGGKLTELKQA